MIIEKKLSPYLIFSQDSITNALNKISINKSGFIFCVSEHGVLEGVLTDGDFRRWVIDKKNISLERSVGGICNKEYITASSKLDAEAISKMFSEKISVIPIIDEHKRLVSIAIAKPYGIHFGDFTITDNSPVFIIAEIGLNHNGSMDMAKKLVDKAIIAGADCVKFQMRNLSELYKNSGDIDDPSEDVGSQYVLDVIANSQLSEMEMYEIFDYCYEKNILPMCTPWDISSIKTLESYGLKAYKIASADLTNNELLNEVAKTGKPVFLSTGMSSEIEIIEASSLLKKAGVPIVLLHCNSTYPAPFKDINLNYIERLKDIGGCPVGYSGHERGFEIPIAAVAMGAKVIEKHFTLDKSLPGNDHRVSLLPDEFKSMVEAIKNVEESIGSNSERVVSQGEKMNREVLAKSLIASTNVKKGAVITSSMIEVKSPGKGLQPNKKGELVGRFSKRDIAKGDFFYYSDIDDSNSAARQFNFKRPWGIPVRYHDYNVLSKKAPIDFVEFHLSFKDLEQDFTKFISINNGQEFVVHSPDLFSGDHILNLASDDRVSLNRSIDDLQRVIDLTRELKKYFNNNKDILIVASLGGFTRDKPLLIDERQELYDRVADSLSKLDTEGVEIIPQTLPPFPWYFGGQLYCNIFVDAEDTSLFCKENGYRLCLDISHSKLTCNHNKYSFKKFVDIIAPYTAHLHIVDAAGVDGEGLQIGEGEIDFSELAKQLDEYCPEAMFIPEIWQGHKNDGEGFWNALSKLEEWF